MTAYTIHVSLSGRELESLYSCLIQSVRYECVSWKCYSHFRSVLNPLMDTDQNARSGERQLRVESEEGILQFTDRNGSAMEIHKLQSDVLNELGICLDN